MLTVRVQTASRTVDIATRPIFSRTRVPSPEILKAPDCNLEHCTTITIPWLLNCNFGTFLSCTFIIDEDKGADPWQWSKVLCISTTLHQSFKVTQKRHIWAKSYSSNECLSAWCRHTGDYSHIVALHATPFRGFLASSYEALITDSAVWTTPSPLSKFAIYTPKLPSYYNVARFSTAITEALKSFLPNSEAVRTQRHFGA